MSLLRSEGHWQAARYPLGFMWNEVRFVRKRHYAKVSTDAVVMHTIIVQALSGGEHLKDLLEKMDDGNE